MEDNRVLPKYATVTTSAGDYNQPPFVTQQLFESAVSYKPENSDVYVATFPKNGTTWMVKQLAYLNLVKLFLNIINSKYYIFK